MEEQKKKVTILKRVKVRLNVEGAYALVEMTDNSRDSLSKFDVDYNEQDGTVLIPISKYLVQGVNGEKISLASGSGTANIKLRIADYDWGYKGKKGHTRRWELIGINFTTWKERSSLDGLTDDSDEYPI